VTEVVISSAVRTAVGSLREEPQGGSGDRARRSARGPRSSGRASWSPAGPRMGIGPVPAVRKVLERAGVSLADVDVVELNEAFAAQTLAVIKDFGLDRQTVNPNGGAIALGHPIAATGAVITAKILSEMEREDHKLGLVTLCIGGGQGIAMLLGRD
jgi:acetyl-CoA acetyltransferase